MNKNQDKLLIKTEFQKEEFIELWNSKATPTEISKQLNMSVKCIYKYVKRFNLIKKRDLNHPHQKTITKRISKMYHKGYSMENIARITKLSTNTIFSRLKHNRVESRPVNVRNNLWNPNK